MKPKAAGHSGALPLFSSTEHRGFFGAAVQCQGVGEVIFTEKASRGENFSLDQRMDCDFASQSRPKPKGRFVGWGLGRVPNMPLFLWEIYFSLVYQRHHQQVCWTISYQLPGASVYPFGCPAISASGFPGASSGHAAAEATWTSAAQWRVDEGKRSCRCRTSGWDNILFEVKTCGNCMKFDDFTDFTGNWMTKMWCLSCDINKSGVWRAWWALGGANGLLVMPKTSLVGLNFIEQKKKTWFFGWTTAKSFDQFGSPGRYWSLECAASTQRCQQALETAGRLGSQQVSRNEKMVTIWETVLWIFKITYDVLLLYMISFAPNGDFQYPCLFTRCCLCLLWF